MFADELQRFQHAAAIQAGSRMSARLMDFRFDFVEPQLEVVRLDPAGNAH